MPHRRPTFSLTRALGEGPDALAIVLVATWLLGTVIAPLAHRIEHAEPAGHCHDDGAAVVCHGLTGSDAPDEPSRGARVRDGSLPDAGSLALAHGAVIADAPLPFAVLPPRVVWLETLPLASWHDRFAGRVVAPPSARGPPVTA